MGRTRRYDSDPISPKITQQMTTSAPKPLGRHSLLFERFENLEPLRRLDERRKRIPSATVRTLELCIGRRKGRRHRFPHVFTIGALEWDPGFVHMGPYSRLRVNPTSIAVGAGRRQRSGDTVWLHL